MTRLRRLASCCAVAVLLASGWWQVEVAAMPYYSALPSASSEGFSCSALIEASHIEGYSGRSITIWLYGPGDVFLGAAAWGTGDNELDLRLTVSRNSIGPGTYRCHVQYYEYIDDPVSHEYIDEDYYASY